MKNEKNKSKENTNPYEDMKNLVPSTDNKFDVGNPILTEENKHLYGNNSNLYSKEYFPKKDEDSKK